MSDISLPADVFILTPGELDVVAGGGFAGVSATWENGSGTASASGFATTTFANAFVAANLISQGSGTPHELFTDAFASVP
jgi:hypothetical protein